jgi:DGQHR domain-containing protein
MVNKDAVLKKHVLEIINNCRFDGLVVDKEIHLNLSGETDPTTGQLRDDREIDVVARFSFAGKQVVLLFECENTRKTDGFRADFKQYPAVLAAFESKPSKVSVLPKSGGSAIQTKHLRGVDVFALCFVYSDILPAAGHATALRAAQEFRYNIWNDTAVQYFRKVTSVLKDWCQFDLLRDFGLSLEPEATMTIPAIAIRQKTTDMYLGAIHPGQLLKIGYVVRRASEKKYAYQRMLSKQRIEDIGKFIISDAGEAILPNAVIAAFDDDKTVQKALKFDPDKSQLTVPRNYCSLWIIDGQHRAFGFVGTPYQHWSEHKHDRFDLPIIIFASLPQEIQTKTFININYHQKRIKTELLCDLATLTKDLSHRLTWASLLGEELKDATDSPLKDLIKVTELHAGRPLSLGAVVQYGLLETLLGYKYVSKAYGGPLYLYAPFRVAKPFDEDQNQQAFKKQVSLLKQFLRALKKNTQKSDEMRDPWRNLHDYALLKPTGINASFLVLSKILGVNPHPYNDLDDILKPLRRMSFKRDRVRKMGGGWQGFRALANAMITKINSAQSKAHQLSTYGKKDKI